MSKSGYEIVSQQTVKILKEKYQYDEYTASTSVDEFSNMPQFASMNPSVLAAVIDLNIFLRNTGTNWVELVKRDIDSKFSRASTDLFNDLNKSVGDANVTFSKINATLIRYLMLIAK